MNWFQSLIFLKAFTIGSLAVSAADLTCVGSVGGEMQLGGPKSHLHSPLYVDHRISKGAKV